MLIKMLIKANRGSSIRLDRERISNASLHELRVQLENKQKSPVQFNAENNKPDTSNPLSEVFTGTKLYNLTTRTNLVSYLVS